jgi:hypothetical protein
MFVPRYSEVDARQAVRTSLSYAEALRKLGLKPSGGNHKLFRRYVDEVWAIPTDHFDPLFAQRGLRRAAMALDAILVEHSTYSRGSLKRRLFAAGLKSPVCELCGQGQTWRGRRMAMILDHANGVPDDNRLENLRIVCPNCNATLETHCGRNNQGPTPTRACARCGVEFRPYHPRQRYCSKSCGCRHDNRWRGPRMSARKVERPSYARLRAELAGATFVAVGRKYGVTDNAVRKWLLRYEREGDA